MKLKKELIQKEILSASNSAFLKTQNFTADHLAKGVAKNIEELSRIVKLTFSSVEQAENFLTSASSDPLIEYVQKGNIYQIDYTPNDSLISEQWALSKIQAFDAWDITLGSDTVLIGIIDTGIDYDHVDLTSKIYNNPGEMGYR